MTKVVMITRAQMMILVIGKMNKNRGTNNGSIISKELRPSRQLTCTKSKPNSCAKSNNNKLTETLASRESGATLRNDFAKIFNL